MKLQIAFDTVDLERALEVASQVVDHADIIEVGTLLISAHGTVAVRAFRDRFQRKTLLADCKIADSGKEMVALFASAGADWITVMAGTSRHVIHAACATAHSLGKSVMLDLIDSSSPGQSALEAKNLGAHAIVFHQSHDSPDTPIFLDKWEMVRGNASLPIFVSAKINRETVAEIIALKPDGIILGHTITEVANPADEVRFFAELCGKH